MKQCRKEKSKSQGYLSGGHKAHMNKYYVYAILDPTSVGKFSYKHACFLCEPFYIGKGSGNRMSQHLQYGYLKENTEKTKRIKGLIEEFETDPIFAILEENMSEESALKLERKIIKDIGRLVDNSGPLTNILKGGNSPPKFYELPKHQQEEIREKFRNKKYSKETIEKRASKLRGKKRPKELVQKLSESRKGKGNPMYGKTLSKDHRLKISSSLINKTGKIVIQKGKDGKFIKEWPSTHEIERNLGYKFSVIARVCRGERNQAYGFCWSYKSI
jgi:hypothetical protein